MLTGFYRLLLGVLHLAAALVAVRAVTLALDEPPPATISYESPAVQALGGPAIGAITYPWREELLGWEIEFVTGVGPIAGYTWSREQRIEVFVRPGATSADLARIFAHELGHAVDVSKNTGDERRAWLAIREVESAPWWPVDGAADFATGAGDFAEAFAVWQVGDSDYRGELAPPPTAEQLELLEALSFD